MQIKLGEKIRELRIRNGRRQEDLSAALGVTNQAVSRWESSGGYPDIELLPAIANYFGITIDELFGYESERSKKVEGYYTKILTMNRQNNGADVCMDTCVEYARECLSEFPDESKLIYALATVLYNAGYVRYGEHHCTGPDGYDVYDVQRHRTYAEWREAVKLYEKLLARPIDQELRSRATKELLQLYANTGEHDKAVSLLSTVPDITACRELLRLNSCDGKERAQAHAQALLALVHQCANLMVSSVMVSSANLTPEESAAAIQNAISLYGAVIPDGNYGMYHESVAHLYLYLSEHLWNAGDRDGAFAALEQALYHAEQFDRMVESGNAQFTAPLVKLAEATVPSVRIKAALAQDWPWWCVPDCSQAKFEMESDPRWSEFVRKTMTES